VPAAHLFFEKSGQQQTLRAGGFHVRAVAERAVARDETVVNGAQVGRRDSSSSASIDTWA
jgi:hypothetical protein